MELGMPTIILLLVVFAAGAAVMLLMMGRWLDLVGEKYKLETQRNAMNLIQLIVSNSPLVERTIDEPNKLVLLASELDNYQTNARIGMETITPERRRWEDCCDFLDFDYNLTVVDLASNVDAKWFIDGNLNFADDDCYPKRVKGIADVPVVILRNGKYEPGIAILQMSRTPLSELSFWLSQLFTRAYWDMYWDIYPETGNYEVFVPLGKEIKKVSISDVDNRYKRICVSVDDDDPPDGIDFVACKMFIWYSNAQRPPNIPITFTMDGAHSVVPDECFTVSISVKQAAGSREVKILYPGV